MKHFEVVQRILQEAVGGQTILMHGNFWRDLTLEEFKIKKVYGKRLIESGNAEESNLIKALEGKMPFGSDTGVSGATIRRMPAGLSPVASEKILFIRQWIEAGCPDEEVKNTDEWIKDLPPFDPVEDTKIVELLKTPYSEHDFEWLKEALQSALKLELFTLPPYLCAWWSIDEDKPDAEYASDSIRKIIIDEMRHMGLVCNMMTTLGITPVMNTIDTVPKYPGPLPGGVNPNLSISLRKLSAPQLEKFMEIEKPKHPIQPESFGTQTFDTIGEFYDAVLEAFEKLPATAYTNQNQITDGGFLFEISDYSKVVEAIDKIKRQGEGTDQFPEEMDNLEKPDLAHYYRFHELFWKRRFIRNDAGHWVNGEEIRLPTVFDMADIPSGGYTESKDFDVIYTNLLDSLQKTWENGSEAEFGKAKGLMFELGDAAKTLMQTPIDPNDPSKGFFGPSFLLIPR